MDSMLIQRYVPTGKRYYFLASMPNSVLIDTFNSDSAELHSDTKIKKIKFLQIVGQIVVKQRCEKMYLRWQNCLAFRMLNSAFSLVRWSRLEPKEVKDLMLKSERS